MQTEEPDKKVVVLFAAENGPYFLMKGMGANIELWGISMDAREYYGPHPVVAHPPCERWGKYWSGGPSAKVRRLLGDDEGCFESALHSVMMFGGVLEHPAYSHAWAKFGLPRPINKLSWTRNHMGWACHVEQGHYGHPARKATWLYFAGSHPPDLIWGPSQGQRLEEGFHSNEERARARAKGVKPLKRLSKDQRIFTPYPFANLLISLVRGGCDA